MQVPSTAMSGPENNEERRRGRAHLKAIIGAVLATGELDDPRWSELAVVFSISAGGRNFGNSGYAYGKDGAWWAVSFPVLALREPVLDFLADVRDDSIPEALTRVLLQYNRTTNRIRLITEFNDPDRWQITPETAREMVDQLQPRFPDSDDARR
ncbi:hypothetical protein M8997_017775 [Phyllobacterium sp. 21LDTY02-6]|jgi:hypothetical protein|uniref:hypothetical protein n=1 Tax=Phyllobacterium sp. 21LDTY02-6 TaxID=2944903 RepID=UPI00202179ED|nr:hypothetical protein [Phyllobacterium sp. 21LDTY02-6]MCO4319046.1 hypothetical protein [Phyllobacterium sp. 21LDTY02-6]